MHLAAALADAGKFDEVKTAIEKIIQVQPAFLVNLVRSSRVNEHEAALTSLLN